MRLPFRNPFRREGAGLAQQRLDEGVAAQEAGDSAGAARCFREAIDADPACAPAHFNLGLLHLSAGVFGEAEAAIREALRARDPFPEAWVALAEALEALGRTPEARDALERALAQREGFEGARTNAAVLHNNQGHKLQSLGRPAEAEVHCRRAAELGPEIPEAHFNLGNVLHDQGDVIQAHDLQGTTSSLRCARRAAG